MASRYRESPHFRHDTAQPEKEMSYAQHVVKALWAQDDARMNAERTTRRTRNRRSRL